MDAFSYLSVLLSIILGLGMTQLLTAAGRMIRHRDRVRFDWLPLLWAGVLFFIYVQVWWSMYGMRSRSDWTFLDFSVVLAQTATLYMMAALALPENIEGNEVDLYAHFDAHRRWSFGFLILALFISILKDFILSGQLPTAVNLAFHGFFAIIGTTGILSSTRRTQAALVLIATAGIVTYVALLFSRLQ